MTEPDPRITRAVADAVRVDPFDRPSPLPAHIPVPDGAGFFHPITMRAIARANLAIGAVEEYARALSEAGHCAPVWEQPVPDTLTMFLEVAYSDFLHRCYQRQNRSALLVPAWVVDYLAEQHRQVSATLIEIPMNPTAPTWEAVAIAAYDDRTPSLVNPRWSTIARYPCRALPAHLEAYTAHQDAAAAATEVVGTGDHDQLGRADRRTQ